MSLYARSNHILGIHTTIGWLTNNIQSHEYLQLRLECSLQVTGFFVQVGLLTV
jgi:hypothetical protein